MNLVRTSLLALAVAASLTAGNAFAATATDDFTVSITIENDCTVSVTDMDFLTQNDLTASHTATSAGSVTCTGSSAWTVDFSAGGSADVNAREMDNGTDQIVYNLYRDAAHVEVLGDGTGGTFQVASAGDDTFTVYGQTAANQNPKSNGTYTDSITATVTF
jgi:spore coat protein U-like protein